MLFVTFDVVFMHPSHHYVVSVVSKRGVTVCHVSSFSDLLQNPTIVPLKMLRGHQRFDDFGILDIIFHPTQPWLFTSAADSTIRLYT